jgi:DNA-binding PadR family transcriptional regulator
MNDLLMLALLLDGPKHGYAIKKQAGLMAGRASMHNNLVYPLLRRFVAEHWVAQRETAGDRGQRRQVYSITPRGRQALVEQLSEFTDSDARSGEAFRLRVGLFEILGPAARQAILRNRRAFLETQDEGLARIEKGVNVGRYGAEAVGHMRRQIAAEIEWIEHLATLDSSHARRSARKGRQRRSLR